MQRQIIELEMKQGALLNLKKQKIWKYYSE